MKKIKIISFIRVFVSIIQILSLLTAVTILNASANGPELYLHSSEEIVAQGHLFEVFLTVKWQQDEGSRIVISDVTIPELPGLELQNISQENSSRLESGRVFSQKIYRYLYKTLETGTVKIGPAVVEYMAAGTSEEKDLLKSNTVDVKIIAYTDALGRSIMQIVIYFVAALAVIGAALFFIMRSKKDDAAATVEEGISAERSFIQATRKIHGSFTSGDHGKFVAGVTKALEKYQKDKYHAVTEDGQVSGDVPDELGAMYIKWWDINAKMSYSGLKPQKDDLNRLFRQTKAYILSCITDKEEARMLESNTGQ